MHGSFACATCDKDHLLLHLAQLLQDLLCVLRLSTIVGRQMGRQGLQRSCSPQTTDSLDFKCVLRGGKNIADSPPAVKSGKGHTILHCVNASPAGPTRNWAVGLQLLV